MATYSCIYNLPLTYNGTMKIGIYCYVTVDILTNVLQTCYLSSPLPNVSFLYKPPDLMATKRLTLRRKYSIFKIISPEAIRGIKLKLYRNVYKISLYKETSYCRCSCALIAMAT